MGCDPSGAVGNAVLQVRHLIAAVNTMSESPVGKERSAFNARTSRRDSGKAWLNGIPDFGLEGFDGL